MRDGTVLACAIYLVTVISAAREQSISLNTLWAVMKFSQLLTTSSTDFATDYLTSQPKAETSDLQTG
jgi:hypothetical protein